MYGIYLPYLEGVYHTRMIGGRKILECECTYGNIRGFIQWRRTVSGFQKSKRKKEKGKSKKQNAKSKMTDGWTRVRIRGGANAAAS